MIGILSRCDVVTVVLHLSRISGILPIQWTTKHSRRGRSDTSRAFELCPAAGVFTVLQVFFLGTMVHSQVTNGFWRGRNQSAKLTLSVMVLSSEIIRLVTVLICLFVRFHRNILICFNQSSILLKEFKNHTLTFNDSGLLLVIVHFSVFIHRIRYTIQHPLNVAMFFVTSLQMTMLEVLLVYCTRVADKSFKHINCNLRRFAFDGKKVVNPNSLLVLMQHHSITRAFFYNLSYSFGPDIVFIFMYSVFKITLLGYLIYYWYFSGYSGFKANIFVLIFEISQILLPHFWIATNCDAALKEQNNTRILLLLIIAEKGNILSNSNIKDVRVFLRQCQSQTVKFKICDHFTFDRKSLYKMILISTTYIIMMIQFHTVL